MQTDPLRLASEDVIVNAPMSFTGSAQRIWRLRRRAQAGWARGLLTALAVLLVVVAWVVVAVWLVIAWGPLFLLTAPYRLLRRGARKRKAEALRHREMLAAVEQRP